MSLKNNFDPVLSYLASKQILFCNLLPPKRNLYNTIYINKLYNCFLITSHYLQCAKQVASSIRKTEVNIMVEKVPEIHWLFQDIYTLVLAQQVE